MRMSKTLEATRAKKPTLQKLAAEVDHLRERVEDLEDLRDLKEAVQRNGDKPLIPLAKVKKDLDLP
jgi:polyhydroxyalkanoate synthesis regulator phasin